MVKVRKISVAILAVAVLNFPLPAYGYIDPATASMLIQLILAGIAFVLVLGRKIRQRILNLFKIRRPRG